MDSKTSFTVSTTFVDNSLINIEKNNQHSISLSLVPQGITSGNVTSGILVGQDSKGQYQFNNLLILSSGLFIISASCPGAINGLSKQINITNYVKSLTITTNNTTFVAFKYFGVKFNLIGNDDNVYILRTSVMLTIASKLLSSSLYVSATNGTGEFFLYKSISGINNIAASVAIKGLIPTMIYSNTIEITITQALLEINLNPSVIFIQPSDSRQLFNISIGVYDSNNLLLTLATRLTANLSIVCNTTCSGTSIIPALKSGTIINGKLDILNEAILSSGIFSISATVADMEMVSYITNPITYHVSKVILTPKKNTLSVYVTDPIDIIIYATDNTLYNPICTVSITDEYNNELANGNIANGSGTINIFISSIGNATIKGTCNNVSGTAIIKVDKLKLKFLSNTMVSVIFI